MMRLLILIAVTALLVHARPALSRTGPGYQGYRALVVEPENFWGWDTAVLAAVQGAGFQVDYGPIPESAEDLAQYELVALTIKRRLTPEQQGLLGDYVRGGGAVYGSWGGPMGTPSFLREVCGVASSRSVRLSGFELLDSPLSVGFGERHVDLVEHWGHTRRPEAGWEIVAVEPTDDGIAVAADAEGRTLGVLNSYGRGRTAVLGFGPEHPKQFADREVAPVLLDNLLEWLLPGRRESAERDWPGVIEIALPARARVMRVSVDGRMVREPAVRTEGSLQKLALDVRYVAPGETLDVAVEYEPLEAARNVEVWIHLPWGVLTVAADSPADLADYLQSLHATIVQPLLRDSHGRAWYSGMADDRPDERLVADYDGNFLSDLIDECHTRGIRVVAGIYFDNASPMRRDPTCARIARNGEPVKNRWGVGEACFHHPAGQEYNLETIRQLLDNYDVQGMILDDTFEMDSRECFCAYCRAQFQAWCEQEGIECSDPPDLSDRDQAECWRRHRREATARLARRVAEIAHEHNVPAGGWVGASMGAVHLAEYFDFLGGMVYRERPAVIRGPLSVLGDCDFVCLLWAPNAPAELMEAEVREAVFAGAAAVGFWIRGEDGGYRMDPERTAAMRRALGRVEQDWREFYAANVIGGDGRFAVVAGQAGPDLLSLTVRNTGSPVEGRVAGTLEISMP
jgi:hypothetical protein